AGQIFESIEKDFDYKNGGNFSELENLIDNIKEYKLVYWFADVPNEKPKLINDVKRRNKACVLVTSKRNIEGKYTFPDLVYHSLGIKSNLLLEFTKKDNRYRGRVIDPLGNVFLDYNTDFDLVGKVLDKRANELLSYSRVPSMNIVEGVEIPNKKEFFEITKEYGVVFHDLIHAHPEAVNRFFGNASFRCEGGFPSFKSNDMIFVSERNMDKRKINKNSFVGVKSGFPVRYFGEKKPSVDTPIQTKLYDYYKNINYMLHSHVYVSNAPFTKRVIPCGAIEEFYEIAEVFPDKNNVNFSVNLRGHGSLVLADSVEYLKEIQYIARETPEIVPDYEKSLVRFT
ncbi:MAG: class II aldolase/adducin family protein, partial [archaeon]